MKLYKVNHEIWGNNIYLLPTIQINTRNPVYGYRGKNLAVELHFLIFHVRFLFLEGVEKDGTKRRTCSTLGRRANK